MTRRRAASSSSTSTTSLAGTRLVGLINKLRPRPSIDHIMQAMQRSVSESSATPGRPTQRDGVAPPTPSMDDIRPPVFESEELNDLFYGSSSSSQGSVRPLRTLAAAGSRPLQKTRSSIQFGTEAGTRTPAIAAVGLAGAAGGRRVLSASTAPGSVSREYDGSSAGESSAERGGSIGVGWRGVKRDIYTSRSAATDAGEEHPVIKSPLAASVSGTASSRVPLSRLTSSERVVTVHDAPSTTHRPLVTLSSSAVTPGLPGRERLGASAIGLSESSKRFRSAFRLTKPLGAAGGPGARRAGRARPEDLLEEAPSSANGTDNEESSPTGGPSPDSSQQPSYRRSQSPQALESAQLVPELSAGPSSSSSSTVQPRRPAPTARAPRRTSELDPANEADSEPSPIPHLAPLPPAPPAIPVPLPDLASRRRMPAPSSARATQMDDLMLAPRSPPDADAENRFAAAAPGAARTRPGRAPLASKEDVPIPSPFLDQENIVAPPAPPPGSRSRTSPPPRGGAGRGGWGRGSASPPASRDSTVDHNASVERTAGGGGGGTLTMRAGHQPDPSASSPPTAQASKTVRGRPAQPNGVVGAASQAGGRRPLADISRAAHYNARAEEAIVGDYQVPLRKESPPVWNGSSSQGATATAHARPPLSSSQGPPDSTASQHHASSQQQPQQQQQPKKSSRNYITVNGTTYARAGLLGKGGSSKVWRVLDAKNAIYALKVVTLSQGDHETYHSFCNEIRLLEQLKGHDRVISLIDSEVDEQNKRLSLVMEIGDVDLNALLTEQLGKPISMNFLRHIWEQMLQAVQVVHDADIVHTDLKPANFVLVKGNLKLIDFGIAKAIPNDTTNIARDSQIGTANYMSPEALSDSGLGHNGRLMKMGRATDVWALGCILYQMVYGHTPYSKIRPMHLKIMAIQNPAHVIDFPPAAVPVNERGEPLEHLQVPVGQDLERVMRGCLRFEPKRRMTIPDLLLDPFLTGTAAASPAPVEDDGMLKLNPAAMTSLVSRIVQWSATRPQPPTKEQQERFAEQLVHSILASQ